MFAPNDFFGVLPDGTAWLARGHQNRVDWRSPDGKWIRGQGARLHKGAGDAGGPRPGAGAGARAGQAVRHAAGAARSSTLRRAPSRRSTSRLAVPNGEVWLQRPRAQEDAPLVYDVVDRKGVWRREVEFPGGRVAGRLRRRGRGLRIHQGGRRASGACGRSQGEASLAQSRIGGSSPGGVFGPGRSVRRRSRRRPSSYHRRVISPGQLAIAEPERQPDGERHRAQRPA